VPVFVTWGLQALFGWLAVLLTRRSEEIKSNAWGWIALSLIGFEACCITPYSVYTFRFYNDWSLHYLVDPDIYPQVGNFGFLLSALIIIANFALLISTYLLSRLLVLRGQLLLFGLPALIAVGFLLADIILFAPRMVRVSDYFTYMGGGGTSYFTHPIGLLGMGIYLIMILLLVGMRHFAGTAVEE
jgi:hypothetical protein